jgi:hypothetical protein
MKMKKHIITTSVLLAAFLVVLGIAVMGTFVSAHAGDISVYTDGPWLMFSFEGEGIDAKGCGPADPGALSCSIPGSVDGTQANAPPWTFTGSATLTVADIGLTGEIFDVYDNMVFVGTTSTPPNPGTFCGSFDPENCPGASTGTFAFGPGAHSITIIASTVQFAPGTAFFRLDTEVPPDEDGDGVPDDIDLCNSSELGETVVIGECDSGVENQIFADGCTVTDLVFDCDGPDISHGKWVSCVAHVLNDLKAEDVISGVDKDAIQSCAAHYK